MKFAWQQIPSPIVSEILCSMKNDGLVLDTEHGAFNNETLVSCIQVATLMRKKCLVRLAKATTTMIRICLDAGASGLIFSTVESGKSAKRIMDICHYPSQRSTGRRGMGLVRQNSWGRNSLTVDKPIMIAQIETKEGVDCIHEIARHKFDYYLIGPYDLTSSLGCEGNFDNPAYLSAIKAITDLVGKSKMGVHIPSSVKTQIHKYSGYGILALGMDTTLMIEAHKEIFEDARF